MNPRPLGYEPYDASLWRLGPSLAGVVTSADRTDPVSPCRLRLPRLVLSRRVRFTNRFTEQAIDLQFPYSFRPFRRAIPGLRTVCGLARQRRLRSCPALSRGALVMITAPDLHQGTGRALPCPDPPPNPTAAGPHGRRVLSRVGAADHAVTPQAPWTGSGWREYSYGGFGGGHPHFHLHADRREADLVDCTVSLKIRWNTGLRRPVLGRLGQHAATADSLAGRLRCRPFLRDPWLRLPPNSGACGDYQTGLYL